MGDGATVEQDSRYQELGRRAGKGHPGRIEQGSSDETTALPMQLIPIKVEGRPGADVQIPVQPHLTVARSEEISRKGGCAHALAKVQERGSPENREACTRVRTGPRQLEDAVLDLNPAASNVVNGNVDHAPGGAAG